MKTVNIKFDKFLKCGKNAWAVEIGKQQIWCPYSLCELDEVSQIISCPLWLVIKKELEDYIDNE